MKVFSAIVSVLATAGLVAADIEVGTTGNLVFLTVYQERNGGNRFINVATERGECTDSFAGQLGIGAVAKPRGVVCDFFTDVDCAGNVFTLGSNKAIDDDLSDNNGFFQTIKSVRCT